MINIPRYTQTKGIHDQKSITVEDTCRILHTEEKEKHTHENHRKEETTVELWLSK